MARGKAVIFGLLLLAVALAGCGASSVGTQLVAPPAATAPPATVVVTLPATPAAAAVPTAPPSPAPTSPPAAPPAVAPAPTRTAPPPSPTVPPTTVPTRPPTATPTKPPAPTATRPPPPTAPPPTAVPGGKARSVARGPATRRMIALTFDAGADRGFAAKILDTLRDTGVQATFGMTGKWAEQNPDLIRRMVAEGHLLMNHTYDHASFTGYSPATRPLTADERRREIERTEGVIAAIAGAPLRPYFRPPYGDYDDAMLVQLGQLGYAYNVMWTVDSLGWNGRTAAQIVQRCVDGAVPGAILLFHVGAESQDAAALPELIRRLRADGYTFGTIAELLR